MQDIPFNRTDEKYLNVTGGADGKLEGASVGFAVLEGPTEGASVGDCCSTTMAEEYMNDLIKIAIQIIFFIRKIFIISDFK